MSGTDVMSCTMLAYTSVVRQIRKVSGGDAARAMSCVYVEEGLTGVLVVVCCLRRSLLSSDERKGEKTASSWTPSDTAIDCRRAEKVPKGVQKLG
jgi:hypothetical protein